MSDLGGSHSWLLDVGGGTDRDSVRADVGSASRPGDAELAALLGAEVVARSSLGDRIERIATATGGAILKYGGFRRRSVELSLYQHVLDPGRDGSPRLIAADAATGVLLIEDLGPAVPIDVEDPGVVVPVFRRLADVHAAHASQWTASSSDRGAAAALRNDLADAPLAALDASAFATKAKVLLELVRRATRDTQAWELGSTDVERATRLQAWAGAAGSRLATVGPVTLLHGDFQRRNWLIADGEARILDWELAALGPGVLDLYYLSPVAPGAGHAPAGDVARVALAAYSDRLGISLDDVEAALADAIVWGGLTGALARLLDFYADRPLTRTPRGELPGVAAAFLRYAADRL